jgi:5-(carboxyamino)imidazole ribonucleotide synthase
MLALAAAPIGLKPSIFSESSEDPAAQVSAFWRPGNLQDPSAVREFARTLEYLTFESEFIDADFLRKALSGLSVRVFPSLDCLEVFQDRKSQKEKLKNAGINTSPFFAVNTESDLRTAFQLFRGEFVLKLRKYGYDGKGTFYCKSERNLAELKPLLTQHKQGFIAEAIIAFKSECALMMFRSLDGSVASYPLMQTHQADSRCDWVLGPVSHPKLKSLIRKLTFLMNEMDYVGALGVELFNTGKELMVNELAPRVHNSGHFSQNAMTKDQFTLHLQCGLGAPLTPPKPLAKAYGMANLLGHSQRPPRPVQTTCALHWYGKSDNRPGRKMGHLNDLGATKTQVLKILLRERKKFEL